MSNPSTPCPPSGGMELPMDRFLSQFAGYFLVAGVVFVGWMLNIRAGAEVAGLMVIVFLLSEIAKKDGFYTLLYKGMSTHQVQHVWRGAAAEGLKPSMRNMAFSSSNQDPFILLVGLRVTFPALGIDWFHTYGAIESDEYGEAVVRTWMGKGPCTFMYQSTIPGDQIRITHGDEMQDRGLVLTDYTHWPHWYQMWPFYLWG